MSTQPKYIVETPNQIWGVYSYDNKYPVSLAQRGESRHAALHVFSDLAIAKAADENILDKIGTGNATRYRYANKLRVIK